MSKSGGIFSFFCSLYRDGFRNMTWGKPLVWLIILKEQAQSVIDALCK